MNGESPKVEIISGPEARKALDTGHVRALVENLMTGVFKEPEGASAEQVALLHAETFERIVGSVEQYADSGQIVVALADGEVAGIAAYEKFGSEPDGRSVYEIRRVSILPEFRGGKIFPQPAQQALETVRKIDPEAVVMIHTKHPKVRDWAISQEFRPTTHEHMGEIAGMEEDHIRSWKKFELPDGWGVYVMDPVTIAGKNEKLRQLGESREAKNLGPWNMDVDELYYIVEQGFPIKRSDLAHPTGEQPIVLTREDLRAMGVLRYIHATGKCMRIEPENIHPNDVLVLQPDELGNEEME